jgi:ADP-ribose pyrophosphatase YjhB (NUDIX family)
MDSICLRPVRLGTPFVPLMGDKTPFAAKAKTKIGPRKLKPGMGSSDPSLVVGGVGRYINGTRLLPGETEARVQVLSGPHGPGGRFTFRTIHTRRGRNGQEGPPLPHPFIQLGLNPSEAAVVAPIYLDKNGTPRVYTVVEERPAIGRKVLWLPGGIVEHGESPGKAALREGVEESRGFKAVSPLVVSASPFPESPANMNMMLYPATVLVNLNRRSRDRREEPEKGMLDFEQRKLDPTVAQLLDPRRFRQFVHAHHQEILDSGGNTGTIVGHPLMFVASLLGDQIRRLLKHHKHKMTRFSPQSSIS